MSLLHTILGLLVLLATACSAQGPSNSVWSGIPGYRSASSSASPPLVFSSTNPQGGKTECRADGLNIRCMKSGYEADTLTVRNKLSCYDGSHCAAVYYNIAVYYARCNQPGKNVKNYGNRFLRPHEAYSYYFAKANRNRCLEYVIHTCTMHTSTTRPIDCSSVFDITTY